MRYMIKMNKYIYREGDLGVENTKTGHGQLKELN